MDTNCIFCKIIQGEFPSESVFENEKIIAFKDIHPQATHHFLIVPKKHIPMIKDLNENEGDDDLVGRMVIAARNIARDKKLSGYQLRFNVDKAGGQEVFHIHLHLISKG